MNGPSRRAAEPDLGPRSPASASRPRPARRAPFGLRSSTRPDARLEEARVALGPPRGVARGRRRRAPPPRRAPGRRPRGRTRRPRSAATRRCGSRSSRLRAGRRRGRLACLRGRRAGRRRLVLVADAGRDREPEPHQKRQKPARGEEPVGLDVSSSHSFFPRSAGPRTLARCSRGRTSGSWASSPPSRSSSR